MRALTGVKRGTWSWSRAIRAALGVGAPLLIAVLTGNVAWGMWVSMGALLLAVGERTGTYAARFRQIAVTAPLAAAGFACGLLADLAWPVVVAVMTAVAFAAGIVSGISNALSIGTMQALLISAIAVGVPSAAPYWPAAALFLVGALWYSALLMIEAVFARRRPWRTAVVDVVLALAAAADDRVDGDARTAHVRSRFNAAVDALDAMVLGIRGRAMGPSREADRASAISRAADHLFARLVAQDADVELCEKTAARLRVVAEAVDHGRPRPPWTAAHGTLVRLSLLEAAIWGDLPLGTPTADRRPARHLRFVPGADLIGSAARLAACTGLAYLAFLTLPLAHGYWIPLTVALVVKPDLGSVFGRAVLRSVGTVAGALVAVAIAAVATVDLAESIAVLLLAAVLPWAVGRSYAHQALVLTPLIMLLIGLVATDVSAADLTVDRIVTTLLGGVIAIVAGYLIWPASRHPAIAPAFAGAVSALATYAAGVASEATDTEVQDDRRAAYRRLSDVRVRLQRTLAEPPPAGPEAWAWFPAVSTAERIADRLTDVSGRRSPRGPSESAQLAAIADRIAHFAPSADRSQGRPPAAIPAGAETTDPLLAALADDVASLAPLLDQRSSGGSP
ncbi:FUSC family protein [Microbacterium awajiense]|uniref:FUSC family protein n=2 Tax=Microbacterium awajiense TaxID=415214 RepID=A0ABP7AK82_9MICO